MKKEFHRLLAMPTKILLVVDAKQGYKKERGA